MYRNSVKDWESLIHKSIRVNDGFLVGNVDAIDYTQVLVSTERARIRYKIPKHIVKGFDDHGVFLKSAKMELERFNGGRDEGVREVR
jgi:hypothetical protein